MTRILSQATEPKAERVIDFQPSVKASQPILNIQKKAGISVINGKKDADKKAEESKTLCQKAIDIITWIPSKFIQLMQRVFSSFTSNEEKEAPSDAVITANPLLSRFNYKAAPVDNTPKAAPVGFKAKALDGMKRFGHFVSEKAKAGFEELKCVYDGGVLHAHEAHYFNEGARIAAGKGAITKEQMAKLSDSDHVSLLEGAFYFEGLREGREALDKKSKLSDEKFNELLQAFTQNSEPCAKLANDKTIAQWKSAFALGKLLAPEVEITVCNQGRNDQYYDIDISAERSTLSPELRKGLMEAACEGEIVSQKDPFAILDSLVDKYSSASDYSLNLRKSINEASRFRRVCEEKGEKRQEALVEFFEGLTSKTSKFEFHSWSTPDALRSSEISADLKMPKQYEEELAKNQKAREVFGLGLAKHNIALTDVSKNVQELVKGNYTKENERVGGLINDFTKNAQQGFNYFDKSVELEGKALEIQQHVKKHPELAQQSACQALAQHMLTDRYHVVAQEVAHGDLAKRFGLTETQAQAIVDGFKTLRHADQIFRITDKGVLRLVKENDLVGVQDRKKIAQNAPKAAKELIGVVAFDLAAAGITPKIFNLSSFFETKIVEEAELAKMNQAGEAFFAGRNHKSLPKDCKGEALECFMAGEQIYFAECASKACKEAEEKAKKLQETIQELARKRANLVAALPAVAALEAQMQLPAYQAQLPALTAQRNALVAANPELAQIEAKMNKAVQEIEKCIEQHNRFAPKIDEYFQVALAKAFLAKTNTIKDLAKNLQIGNVDKTCLEKQTETEVINLLVEAQGKVKAKQTPSAALIAAAEKYAKEKTEDQIDALRNSDTFVALLHKHFKADVKNILFALGRGSLFKKWSEKAEKANREINTEQERNRLQHWYNGTVNGHSNPDSDALYQQLRAIPGIAQMSPQQLKAAWDNLVSQKVSSEIESRIRSQLTTDGLDQEEVLRLGMYGVLALVENKGPFQAGNKESQPLYRALMGQQNDREAYTKGVIQALALGLCNDKVHGKALTGNAIFDATTPVSFDAVKQAFSTYPEVIEELEEVEAYATLLQGDMDRIPYDKNGIIRLQDKLLSSAETDLNIDLALLVAHKEKMTNEETSVSKQLVRYQLAVEGMNKFMLEYDAAERVSFPKHYKHGHGAKIVREQNWSSLISNEEAEVTMFNAYKAAHAFYQDALANGSQALAGHDAASVKRAYDQVYAAEEEKVNNKLRDKVRAEKNEKAQLRAQANRVKADASLLDDLAPMASVVATKIGSGLVSGLGAVWGGLKGAASAIEGSSAVKSISAWMKDENNLLNGYVHLALYGVPFHDQVALTNWLRVPANVNNPAALGLNAGMDVEATVRAIASFARKVENKTKVETFVSQCIKRLVLCQDSQARWTAATGLAFDINQLQANLSAKFGDFNGNLAPMVQASIPLAAWSGKFVSQGTIVKLPADKQVVLPAGMVLRNRERRMLEQGASVDEIAQIISTFPAGTTIEARPGAPVAARAPGVEPIIGWNALPNNGVVTDANWGNFMDFFVHQGVNFFDIPGAIQWRNFYAVLPTAEVVAAFDAVQAQLAVPASLQAMQAVRLALVQQYLANQAAAVVAPNRLDYQIEFQAILAVEAKYGITLEMLRGQIPFDEKVPKDGAGQVLALRGNENAWIDYFLQNYRAAPDFLNQATHADVIQYLEEQRNPIIARNFRQLARDILANPRILQQQFVNELFAQEFERIVRIYPRSNNQQRIASATRNVFAQLQADVGDGVTRVTLASRLGLVSAQRISEAIAEASIENKVPANWVDDHADGLPHYFRYFAEELGINFYDATGAVTFNNIATIPAGTYAPRVIQKLWNVFEYARDNAIAVHVAAANNISNIILNLEETGHDITNAAAVDRALGVYATHYGLTAAEVAQEKAQALEKAGLRHAVRGQMQANVGITRVQILAALNAAITGAVHRNQVEATKIVNDAITEFMIAQAIDVEVAALNAAGQPVTKAAIVASLNTPGTGIVHRLLIDRVPQDEINRIINDDCAKRRIA